jgi:hypothetical protein
MRTDLTDAKGPRERAGEIFAEWALDEKPHRFGNVDEILDHLRSAIPEASAEELRVVLHELAEIANHRAHALIGEAQQMNKLAARIERAARTLPSGGR